MTYIKMNIEGAELDALKGAKQAIIRCKPKLAISAYHRPSDLWQVPELIGSLCPDYRSVFTTARRRCHRDSALCLDSMNVRLRSLCYCVSGKFFV